VTVQSEAAYILNHPASVRVQRDYAQLRSSIHFLKTSKYVYQKNHSLAFE
jgi:hypothetical protein